ncbi:MAG: hypothetical protein HN576_06695 [Bacteriovoracaceae bacterium]|jgi:hypothetical protein|nr:hypothetical protein [Bacteriovoracaceae bacterium]
MKFLKLLFLILPFIIIGCNQPRDRRTAYKARDLDSNSSYNYDYNGNGGNENGNGGNENSNPTATPTPNGQTVPPEISHCSWSSDGVNGFASTHAHIGAYTLCQSSSDQTKVHLQVKSPITDSQVCVIPTYHSNNRAIYIGEPRCLLINSNMSIYPISLLRNRTGYSNFQITGVMVMKDKAFFYPSPFYQYLLSPDAFLFCSQWLDQTGDSSYCYAFDSIGQYVYHQF